MKKICFVTTVFVTYKSFLTQLSKYLYESGEYDVSLICNEEDGIRDLIPHFVHYHPVVMHRGISWSMISAIREIKRILEKNKYDLVQYSTPNAAFYTSIAAKRANIPVRLYCQWGVRYMGFEGWKRALFKWIEKKTCENSTFIEVESHNIRRFSLEEGLYSKEKSCVIWNGSACGVNLDKFNIKKKAKWRTEIRRKYNIYENELVFAFAARLTADKGINELIKAFLNMELNYENIKLIIMGAMDDSTSLDLDQIKRARQSKNVIFAGNVDDIEKYYAAIDVFVAPSYREGFGLVVIEAESMGVPAIVSDVPGQIDAIQNGITGLSCKVKDFVSLQECMEKLMIEFDMREKMGVSARKFVEDNFEQRKLFQYLKEHRDLLINRRGKCLE